ncbi:MAG: DUF4215 domain-containing protein [Myxococcota bacterium]
MTTKTIATFCIPLLILTACGDDTGLTTGDTPDDTGTSTGMSTLTAPDPTTTSMTPGSEDETVDTTADTTGPDAQCGDGLISDESEACDDGNTDDGDGCSAACEIENGFECMDEPSTCASVCGDGLVASDEVCDDGNTDDGDGCSAACEPENGFMCVGEPSVCASICGDGLVASDEPCDDMNVVPGDGCTELCEVENGYECMDEPSTCTTICGDGIVVDGLEECDDMNVMAGDGCSDMCEVEPGFGCSGEPSVCAPCDPSDVSNLRLVELGIGIDYVDLQNIGTCDADYGGLNILFDDSSLPDVDFTLPAGTILAGQTLRISEPGGASDIDTGSNIFFSSSRGGAALLCTGICATDVDVLDVVAFSEGEMAPPLPAGVTFMPGGLSGIMNEDTQVYGRIDFMGVPPDFLAADWAIQ